MPKTKKKNEEEKKQKQFWSNVTIPLENIL